MAKEKKVTKASVILEVLLEGGASIDAIADAAGAKLGIDKPQSLKGQIRGVIAHIQKAKMKKWQAYKVDESNGIKVVKL